MKQWKTEHCATEPEALQLVAPNTYMERRNIQQVEHKADKKAGIEAYTEWVCESREIGVDEYEMLKAITEIDNQKAIDDYTEQLVEEGLL